MKPATYTISCGKTEQERPQSSQLEERFERYMERTVEKLVKGDKRCFDKGFIHIRIEE